MEENLVGYLLNALDPATQREVEAQLRARPEMARELEVLRRALQPLASDRDSVEPPPGLADRTLDRLKEVREPVILKAPPVRRSPPGSFSWWRRPDAIVAAALVLGLIGLGLPLVYRLQASSQRQSCSDNMRLAHQALVDYSSLNDGNFPHPDDRPRHNFAGVYVPILSQAGTLPANFTGRCPANGPPRLAHPSLREVEEMSADDFAQLAPRLSSCYAYSLGYRDADGHLHGLRIDDGDDLPILADRPRSPELDSDCTGRDNSPNHNGQNVLYIGGHVRFQSNPNVGRNDDHIYLNRNRRVAAGVDRDDTVLGLSGDAP